VVKHLDKGFFSFWENARSCAYGSYCFAHRGQLLGLGFSEEDTVWIEGDNFRRLMLIQIVMISSFSIQHTECSEREEQCEKHILKQITYLLCHILLYCVMSSSICSL